MLSILIPVYNFDVRALVTDLCEQAIQCGIEFEIICIDDGSEEEYKSLNRTLKGTEKIKYLELPVNSGRSKIRNTLASEAKYDYFLFMDCDSQTENKNYISNYVKEIRPDAIVYGGRSYTPQKPEKAEKYFRWLYGVKREMVKAHIRQVHPYRSFMTNNFLIPRKLFEKNSFSEVLEGYGHEDTLFGYELKQKEIRIIHIENPLCHIGLEDAGSYLNNTRNGLKNLLYLIQENKIDHDNKLYLATRYFRFGFMRRAFINWFNRKEKKIEQNLLGPHPSLRKFDLYKLGYLLRMIEEKNKLKNETTV